MDVRVVRGGTINVERLIFPGSVDTTADAHARMDELLRMHGCA